VYREHEFDDLSKYNSAEERKNMESTSRNIRIVQIGLSVMAAVTLFLPWIACLDRMMAHARIKDVSGYETPFGKCLAIFLVASLCVSALEARLSRRAAFVHVGFFAATVFVALLVYLLPSIQGFEMGEIRFGFALYLVLATLVFAVSGMLSPRNIQS
jgi:hypothetical protein